MARFRFTLFNDDLYPAGVVVKEPDGWEDLDLVLRRDKKSGALIPFVEGDFLWYGDAMAVFQAVEAAQGPDAKLRLKLEYSEQINKWELVSWHRFNLGFLEELSKGLHRHQMKIPIISNDFYSKFFNRQGVSVDLLGTVDLDGNVIAPVPQFTLPLPSQKIRSSFRGLINNTFIELANLSGYFQFNSNDQSDPHDVHAVDPAWNVAVDNRIQVGFSDDVTLDEVKERNSIPISIVEDEVYTSEPSTPISQGTPAFLLTAKYSGVYRFQPRIEISIYSSLWTNNGSGGAGSREFELTDHFASSYNHIDFYLQVNEGTPILLSKEDSPLVFSKVSTIYTADENLTLLAGDKVKIYAKITSVDWEATFPTPPFGQPEFGNEIVNVIFWGNTNVIYPNRLTFSFLDSSGGSFFYAANAPFIPEEYDAGEAPSAEEDPTRLVITADTIYKDTVTESMLIFDAAKNIIAKCTGIEDCLESAALEDTNLGLYGIQLGKHIRGYTMANKPFAMSWDDWWDGIDPILNLGYDEHDGKIRIEKKSFYRNPENVVSLSWVPDITRTYDQNKLYKSIKQGYSKWSAESESGIDDSQSVRNYSNKSFSTIGQDISNLSTMFAASLGIEQTRRNQVELAKDWRLDEDIVIIALKSDGEGGYLPEVGADFDDVQNLLNPNERINIRISAARNFKRWQNVYNGCLAGFGGQFQFTKGEGNFDMVSTLSPGDFEEANAGEVDEKQNHDANSDFLTTAKLYQFEYPLSWATWKEILANKERAIGLSRTNTGHSPHFIEELRFALIKGKAKFTVTQGGVGEGFILLETGDKILTEPGGFIKVES